MRKYLAILLLFTLLIPLVLEIVFQIPDVEAQDGVHKAKISSRLGIQVAAKRRALEVAPLAEGQIDILKAMQARGAMVTSLNEQRIFIHISEEPNQAQIEELESMGLTLFLDSWVPSVRYHQTGFIMADMPLEILNELSNVDYVIRLDTAERVLEPQNDLGTQKINVDDVWASSYNGTGVTIAVLDSGLDVSHNDIPTPIASWDYAEDDATIANTVTGHGTHVTGSVLGRGIQSSGVYKGIAPGADLVFLKIGTDATGGAPTAAIVNAIREAVDNYTADIITMSYGGWDAYHDGTSQEAQAVDYAVNQGATVFISAGNNANDDEHYSGNVSANSTTDFLQVNVSGAGTGNSQTAFAYNLVWYDGTGTSNDLELEYYDSSYTLLPSTNQTQSESSRGTESEYSAYDYYLATGSYTVYLKVKNNSENLQFFHLYYDSSYNYPNAGTVKFNSPDSNYTIGSPADADSAIAVGAYTTREGWWDFYNDGYSFTGETVDTIATFSSRGPRVDSGAPPKPNIVAPGSAIISCRDDDIYSWKPPRGNPGNNYASALYIDNDGPNADNTTRNDGNGPADYYMMQGTSMACPLAAGVAALILEKNPSLTPAQVKQAIENTSVDEGIVGFDTTYGWGLIDALAAVESIPSTINFSNSPSNHDFGILSENSSYQTGFTYFTVTNTGASPIDITIAGSDMTGGVTWSLSNTAAPAANTYGLKAGLEGDGSYTIIVKKNSPHNTLVSNLPSMGTQRWGFELLSPTSFSDVVQKSGTVTLTATQQ
jgi:subtilisin family serine protease